MIRIVIIGCYVMHTAVTGYNKESRSSEKDKKLSDRIWKKTWDHSIVENSKQIWLDGNNLIVGFSHIRSENYRRNPLYSLINPWDLFTSGVCQIRYDISKKEEFRTNKQENNIELKYLILPISKHSFSFNYLKAIDCSQFSSNCHEIFFGKHLLEFDTTAKKIRLFTCLFLLQ